MTQLALQYDSAVVDAARRFVRAARQVDEANGHHLLVAINERDLAFHELLISLGEPCDCDDGTCPDIADWQPT